MDATVTVTAVEDVGPNTVVIRFESPAGFEALPGQFVRLSAEIAGEGYDRFYTLSSPGVVDTFELTIGVDPEEGGPFSGYLASLEPGDGVEMSGPFGDAHYEGEARSVVLAGGPGVGPAVGIAERALDDGNEAAVVYRYDGDAPAHEGRLDALRQRGGEVVITGGEIDEAVAEALTGDGDEQAFVYGFAEFIEQGLEAIRTAGVDTDTAKVENFG